MPELDYVTFAEAGRRLSLSREAVRQIVGRLEIPVIRIGPNCFIRIRDLDRIRRRPGKSANAGDNRE